MSLSSIEIGGMPIDISCESIAPPSDQLSLHQLKNIFENLSFPMLLNPNNLAYLTSFPHSCPYFLIFRSSGISKDSELYLLVTNLATFYLL